MKPDWKDAPSWARWLACNFHGHWVWFSHKPRAMLKTNSWKVLDLLNHDAISAGLQYSESLPYRRWKESLEKRPKQEGEK